ncbi:MAG: ABC transporter ATP-binding protein/permease [Acholeplasmataceae bacterium]|nr:ABC transporter ATP-binding protein/permease [Acholeplasmataceae bacterium]
MKFILSLIKPYWRTLTVSLSFKSIASLADLFLPWLIAYMIDETIPELRTETDPSLWPLYLIGLMMVAIAFTGVILNIMANRMAEKIAAESVRGLRHDLFDRMTRLSARQVDALTRPSLISRMTSDTYNIYTATAFMQRLGVRAPVLLLGGIIMSLTLDVTLTLIIIMMLPLITIIIYVASRKGIPLYRKTQESLDKLIRKLREYISGARVVRALSMNTHEKEAFDTANQHNVNQDLKAHITMARINPMMNAVMNIGLVIVLVAGAFRLDLGLTKQGEIIAFVTYFTIILNAMMSVTRIFVLSSRATASGDRINEVLDMPEDIKDGFEPVVINPQKPIIEFKDVCFSYNQKEDNLSHISFSLYQGQTLGIIGATGSGKTTLINLLMRFYDVDSGEVRFYGKNIKDLRQDDLRKRIGVVFQNDLIFADSIYGNIQFNRNRVTNEDVELATRVAQAEFIASKEDALDHMMAQKGMNLSGGQKQRVLIARAIAGKPNVVVLDDASSALDYQTDMNMRRSLKDELKETTMIVIAQRIASIRNADLILLVNEGKIEAMGTHRELMEISPTYKEISDYQLGGELS